ncbi:MULTISPECIES: glycoside hydrolase family 9 protein [unclassified Oceanispirochaeta]|uniref:glycoside hydrolase family 9 protein n=1 Tax=unclassified Oceanispirochaeta TaxID=2635722 RepID=UPI000E095B9C|nr:MULTISPECIES: glycoside hydrolase family 9 protein [unclassified Oceanispirochaeta]MBF9016201.1 glycoside hydrolase family 9 protein [Oceanispirochaeta sp. M2]NPD72663.1 hypothetical protein [Oceanispirochaeta sp. M1]RDG31813.1 hypothetical protein DV872_11195 [Oceanispirochaeta sp. M1]
MIHVNQKGCSRSSGIRAVYQSDSSGSLKEAGLVDAFTGIAAANFEISSMETVPGWKNRYFQKLSFSGPLEPGRYRISGMKDNGESEFSENFTVSSELIAEKDLSDLLVYFKTMRSDGIYDEADRDVPVWESNERRDASGGWYDASGDTSKYLSHLSYAERMNPQQTPLVVWILSDLIRRYDNAHLWAGDNFRRWVQFEMNHGADFLLKMQHEEGWFYKILFDQWSKDPEARMLCSYKTQNGERLSTMKAGFREGGGMACAALASAAVLSEGERKESYLKAAESGYSFLKEHNREVLEKGGENLIDWYCALSASLELYRAGRNEKYREDISYWSRKILSAFHSFNDNEGWWFVIPEEKIPYYHASDEGLLIIAVKASLEFLEGQAKTDAENMLNKALSFLADSLLADPDPFYYPRHWVEGCEKAEYKWFYPHENPSGYWWQGENSRISSLGAALLYGESDNSERLQQNSKLALSVLDWQLGLNPFNVSMIDGWGAGSPEYEGDYYNLPGGVANGITSGFDDEKDIAFQPELEGNPGDNSWRWGEQWIPHAAWFLMLSSLLREKGL